MIRHETGALVSCMYTVKGLNGELTDLYRVQAFYFKVLVQDSFVDLEMYATKSSRYDRSHMLSVVLHDLNLEVYIPPMSLL